MPTQSAIARDWQTSREYVRQCVLKGCPTDSFENAREWRAANTTSRQTTASSQLSRIVAEEKDDDSPGARERRKKYFEGKPDGANLPSNSSLDDALHNAVRAADEAWRLLEEAMIEEKDSKISIRLSVHNKAVDARFRAETSYREELERRRVLIPLTEAQDMARRGYEIIISRLSALPQNIAPRCNPHDPHHAMDILQSECIGIISDAQKAFAA